jgi:hypothetical protein
MISLPIWAWLIVMVVGAVFWIRDVTVSRPKRRKKATEVKQRLYGDGPEK